MATHVQLFAKVDAHLDTHPKIEDAGFWGSTVFQALLRINRANGFDGEIPERYCSPRYLARRLRLDCATGLGDTPENLMFVGVADCCSKHVNLLEVTEEGGLRIVGWDEEWRGALSEAERARRYRESKKSSVTDEDDASRTVTDRHAISQPSHIREEKIREEKIREDKKESARSPSKHPIPAERFESVYQLYPRKQGKAKGLTAAKAKIRTEAAFQALSDAVSTMATAWQGRDTKFCPHWSTFINQERWLDDELPLPGTQPAASRQNTNKRGLSSEDIWRMAEDEEKACEETRSTEVLSHPES